jgi:TRAP-type C4-dicarboxylate transport system substrate-binding protein
MFSQKLLKTIFIALITLATASAHAAVTLKIATIAPEGTTWMNEMRSGAKEIARQTEGRVKLKFYPGGVMGNDKSVMKKIRLGQLHGGALTGGSLATIYPDMQIYSLPMFLKSYEEADYLRPKIDPLLKEGMKKKGFVILGISEGGFAYIMSDKPVRSIEDLNKRKMWVPEDDYLNERLFKNMGISPIPLSIADVYTGLQTGLIDTLGSTPMAALAFQWHTRIGAVTDVPLVYLVGVLVVDQKRFKKIQAEDQKIVLDVMDRVFKDMDRLNRSDNDKALAALNNRNIEFVVPSTAELKRWKQYASQVIEQLGDKASSEKLYLQATGILTEFRNQGTTASTQ